MNAAFNDEEVLKYNKRPANLPTRKMAECRDYPQYDLFEFYRQLSGSGDQIGIRCNEKAWQLHWKKRERTFCVRRKK